MNRCLSSILDGLPEIFDSASKIVEWPIVVSISNSELISLLWGRVHLFIILSYQDFLLECVQIFVLNKSIRSKLSKSLVIFLSFFLTFYNYLVIFTKSNKSKTKSHKLIPWFRQIFIPLENLIPTNTH